MQRDKQHVLKLFCEVGAWRGKWGRELSAMVNPRGYVAWIRWWIACQDRGLYWRWWDAQHRLSLRCPSILYMIDIELVVFSCLKFWKFFGAFILCLWSQSINVWQERSKGSYKINWLNASVTGRGCFWRTLWEGLLETYCEVILKIFLCKKYAWE